MAAGLPNLLVPGMPTLDVLKLLSGQPVVNDKPGSPWSGKRPKDTGDFNVKHDHGGDGHMCDPGAALRHLQKFKNAEKKGTKNSKDREKDEDEGEGSDARAARQGFEQCLNDVMPGLMHATSFAKPIPCHTAIARTRLRAVKKTALDWLKRLKHTGQSKNEIAVATKTRRAVGTYNGFQACLKDAIPTLHEEILGVDE